MSGSHYIYINKYPSAVTLGGASQWRSLRLVRDMHGERKARPGLERRQWLAVVS